MDGALDSMMGLVPLAMGAGIVMTVTDRMLGDREPARPRRRNYNRRQSNMAYADKITGKDITKVAAKEGAKGGKSFRSVRLGKNSANPAGTKVHKAVKNSMKGYKPGRLY